MGKLEFQYGNNSHANGATANETNVFLNSIILTWPELKVILNF